jgi:hypothetical protein
MERHGWITPLPNGMKACCGGPGICPICQAEQRLQTLVDAAQALKDARARTRVRRPRRPPPTAS